MMWMIYPGNAQRAQAIERELGAAVDAALDGSSSLWALVPVGSLGSFLARGQAQLHGFQVQGHRIVQEPGPLRWLVQFGCEDYRELLSDAREPRGCPLATAVGN